MKRVRATAKGYAPREPGQVCQLIREGEEFLVEEGDKAKWFEDLDPPAEKGGKGKPKSDSQGATE